MNNNLSLLANQLVLIKDSKKMKSFLSAILTPKELEEIPKRLEIVKMLKKNTTQREIAKKLKVGIATVTRGSRELKLKHFQDV